MASRYFIDEEAKVSKDFIDSSDEEPEYDADDDTSLDDSDEDYLSDQELAGGNEWDSEPSTASESGTTETSDSESEFAVYEPISSDELDSNGETWADKESQNDCPNANHGPPCPHSLPKADKSNILDSVYEPISSDELDSYGEAPTYEESQNDFPNAHCSLTCPHPLPKAGENKISDSFQESDESSDWFIAVRRRMATNNICDLVGKLEIALDKQRELIQEPISVTIGDVGSPHIIFNDPPNSPSLASDNGVIRPESPGHGIQAVEIPLDPNHFPTPPSTDEEQYPPSVEHVDGHEDELGELKLMSFSEWQTRCSGESAEAPTSLSDNDNGCQQTQKRKPRRKIHCRKTMTIYSDSEGERELRSEPSLRRQKIKKATPLVPYTDDEDADLTETGTFKKNKQMLKIAPPSVENENAMGPWTLEQTAALTNAAESNLEAFCRTWAPDDRIPLWVIKREIEETDSMQSWETDDPFLSPHVKKMKMGISSGNDDSFME